MPKPPPHGPEPEVLKIEIDPREGLRRLVSAPPMRPAKPRARKSHANGKTPHEHKEG